MKPRTRIAFVVSLAALAAAGCRTDPHTRAYLDTLHVEKRGLEDQIYALEYDLEILEDELAAEREKNAELAKKFGLEPEKSSAPRRPLFPLRKPILNPAVPSKPNAELPEIDLGEPKIDLGEPKIELGTPQKESLPPPARAPKVEPTGQSKQTPASLRTNSQEMLRKKQLTKKNGASESTAPRLMTSVTRAETAERPPITQLYLNPFLTGGADYDGKPGDDGVSVVLEPRTADKEYVPQAGPILVVLLDPAQTGEASRVAKWDLDVVEASRFVKNSTTAQGLHLQLTWPQRPPQNSKLKMFVRYTTPDDEKLTAEQDIFVTLAEQVSSRWTPKGKRTSFTTAANPSQPRDGDTSPSARELAEPSVLETQELESRELLSREFEASELELAAPAQAIPNSGPAPRPRPVWRPERS